MSYAVIGILSMTILINVTLLQCTVNKEKIKIYQQHCSVKNHRECHYTEVIWHIFQWNNKPYSLHCVTLITTIYALYLKLWRSTILVATFPYILDSEVYVWNDFQTIMCIFLWEGTIGQFCTKPRDFYVTFVRLGMNPEKLRCKMMSFYSHFVHKCGLKLQSEPQNVNQYYKCSWQNHKYVISCCFSCILHKIQTIAYCSKFKILGVGVTFLYIYGSRDYVW